jgi:hypothetical protein
LDDFIIRCIRGTLGDPESQLRMAEVSLFVVKILFYLANLFTHRVKCTWQYATLVKGLGFFIDTVHMTFLVTKKGKRACCRKRQSLQHARK